MVRASEAARPDPAALLELAGRDARGKLTVFLGAAPGVGKTYAMLERARRLKADGLDVVVGLIETHGRSETAALLDGLEILPRQAGGPTGQGEFDLDAALARRPALILVDELAHSNPATSRHPKRHQDIAELTAAGIDVWTALNIQHLESLSDLVTRIAGVAVRETVPDIVLKAADEVVLVDLPPAELIDRLNEGKVYLPANARRAIDNFFKPATLTALRELALRRAADRVDDQVVDFLRQSAVEGPWATGERLLVCVGADPLAEQVVRVASRMASGLNARWLAVSLARPGQADADPEALRHLDNALQLAERLGAETRRLVADDFVDEIARLARRENITQIVLGRPRPSVWRLLARNSLADAVLRRVDGVGIHFVPGPDTGARRRRRKPKTLPEWLAVAAMPILSVGAITLLGRALASVVALQNLSMLYLAAVVMSAMAGGLAAAVLAALLSFVAYNFFFIEPVYTLTVARPYEVLALAVFLVVAIATGTLAGRLKERAAANRKQAETTQALYDFSRRLAATYGAEAVMTATASQLHSTLGRPVVGLLPGEDGELALSVAWPPDQQLDDGAMAAARWAFERKEEAGAMTGTLPLVPYRFVPIRSSQWVAGVVGIRTAGGDAAAPTDAERERLVAAMLDQAAVALDRARLTRESALAAVAREGEKLQSALLSSLSHDLRTPLASITGAVTSLRQLGDRMPEESRRDLLASIEEEAGRLTRFVSNLFDMTRIEARTLAARRDAVDLAAIVERAVARVRSVHPALKVDVSVAPAMPQAAGDAALLEQVLFNLLDNAQKYGGGPEQPVAIFVRPEEDKAVISVTDQGKGIPPAELERVFDKFYRRTKGDGRAAGTGLGLSIARGFVEAMGGSIRAESPAAKRRGTRFVIRLPLGAGSPR